ncbi:uncharacterized protein BcabD6B2_11760 [Babesia caballi]|uniref:Membrane protein, putative n=1 Tax=Babesia caballi TaxID=5871 RepID=A0AAV4LNV6_BABCB|nr:membrane protein, putative [Babesia caballi]
MTICDVSLVLGAGLAACPGECPFWSQNAVWKGVGVCTAGPRCSVYNPLLTYADAERSVCLPCAVYGCESCAYAQPPAAGEDSATPLPDVCLKCAPGYRMAEDGRSCFLVERSLWSRAFYALVAAVVVALSALGIRLLLRPAIFQRNLERYRATSESQKAWNAADNLAGGVSDAMRSLVHADVAGVGSALYFRFLAFMVGAMAVVFAISVAHAHIPCSDMIRDFSGPFRLDRPGDLSGGSWWRRFVVGSSDSLRERLLNFKYVDDAIDWSVSQYAEDTARAARLLYLCVMALTLLFALLQRNFLRDHFADNPRVQDFTLVLESAPPLHALEDFVERATGVRPKSVAVVYDLRNASEGLREFLDLHEGEDDAGVYVNVEMADKHRRVLESLQPSGTAFAVFGSRQGMHQARGSLERSGICKASPCVLEPDEVIWENVLNEGPVFRRAAAVTAGVCVTQLMWSLVFFLPYAAYKLHAKSGDVYESLWLCLFAGVGSSLVNASIRRAADRVGFRSRESADSYLMWMTACAQLVNVGLNVLLAHLVNYGGRYKVVSVVKDFALYVRTPTFRVGEEVSLSQSLGSYMVDLLVLIPMVATLLVLYGSPLMALFYVLTADLDEQRALHLLRPSRFELTSRYCSVLVNFTCSLLLQFVIRSKLQALTLSFSLLASSVIRYASDAYVLLRKSAPSRLSGTGAFHNALLLWSVPTGVLAACPAYWRWRCLDGRLVTPFFMFALHVLCYVPLLRCIYRCRRRFEVSEHNASPADYTLGNPVYSLRRMSPL